MERKSGKGRQKIDMKRIENDEARNVCFSKRKGGIFKKAMELNALCGAETAIIVFSPTGKPFAFGHPSVESVIDRFFGVTPTLELSVVGAQPNRKLHKLNKQYVRMVSKLDAEKERVKKYKEDLKNAAENQAWWEKPIETLGFEQLEQLYESLQGLRNEVGNRLIENGALICNANPLFEPQMNAENELGGYPIANSYAYSTARVPSGHPDGFSGTIQE